MLLVNKVLCEYLLSEWTHMHIAGRRRHTGRSSDVHMCHSALLLTAGELGSTFPCIIQQNGCKGNVGICCRQSEVIDSGTGVSWLEVLIFTSSAILRNWQRPFICSCHKHHSSYPQAAFCIQIDKSVSIQILVCSGRPRTHTHNGESLGCLPCLLYESNMFFFWKTERKLLWGNDASSKCSDEATGVCSSSANMPLMLGFSRMASNLLSGLAIGAWSIWNEKETRNNVLIMRVLFWLLYY